MTEQAEDRVPAPRERKELDDSDLEQVSGGLGGDGRTGRSSGITAGGEVLPRKRSKSSID